MIEMPPEADPGPHTVAVFATLIKGQEAGWDELLAEAGRLCAARKWELVFLSEDGNLCTPLLQAATKNGSQVQIVADTGLEAGDAPPGSLLDTMDDRQARLQAVGDLADGFLCLPTSLASIQALYLIWERAGGGSSGKPVAFLNRNRAYEVFRGYAQDVLSQSLSNADRLMMFSDNLEDLLGKLQRELDRFSAP